MTLQKGNKCLFFKHGESHSELWWRWRSMRQRCSDKNQKTVSYYTCLSICDAWNDYLIFKQWAETNGYKAGLSLDRIDNSKGYSPENCRWIPIEKQNRNRRCNKLTLTKANEIRELYKIQKNKTTIANLYGVDPTLVKRIIDGKIWKP